MFGEFYSKNRRKTIGTVSLGSSGHAIDSGLLPRQQTILRRKKTHLLLSIGVARWHLQLRLRNTPMGPRLGRSEIFTPGISRLFWLDYNDGQ